MLLPPIHREGKSTLVMAAMVLVSCVVLTAVTLSGIVAVLVALTSAVVFGFLLFFFRNPPRVVQAPETAIVAPCDGKVVAISEVFENEYFKDRRMLVSIFMSPLDVHVNRNPIGGMVTYVRYHPGRYWVAWHPKASEHNERTTIVYKKQQYELLMRQIAGVVARRIVCYVQAGDSVGQGAEMGFIKFGSRIDLYLPLHCRLHVSLKERVRGGVSIIGELA